MFDAFMAGVLGYFVYKAAANLFLVIKEVRQQVRNEIEREQGVLHKSEVVEGIEQEYPIELPDGVRSIKFEVLDEHDGLILCLDTDGNFLCQGKTMSEIQDNFRTRFPEDAAVIVDPEAKALYQEMMMHEAP
jgi:hypothetical protein